jgi:hypothetical protein
MTAISAPTPLLTQFQADNGNRVTHRRGRNRQHIIKLVWKELLGERERVGHDQQLPCPWELARPIQAVSLALEAAGSTPSAVDAAGTRVTPGYSVTSSTAVGTVRVTFRAPARWEKTGSPERIEPKALEGRAARALDLYRRRLTARGWQVTAYKTGTPQEAFLLVVPCTA